MKYTKENLRGIAVKSTSLEESLEIIEKFKKLGFDVRFTGCRTICYYGFNIDGVLICRMHIWPDEFNTSITCEEFMNENIILDNPINDNYEIF